ncbi:MAG TPA: hypothetical protein DHV89_02575 [Ruminococcus sp.]|nr:hypothetical protein [Ruminococcus sp.]
MILIMNDINSMDEKMRLAYLARQKYIADTNTLVQENIEKGIVIGRAEGRAEERRSLIEKLRADGIDEEFIKKYFE